MRISDWSSDVCSSDLRDVVVVPERHQLAQAQGAGERGGLVRDAFHHAAVAHEHPGAVVDHGEFGAVEALREQLLGQREAHGVGEALAERAGGGLHARGHEVLGMAGGLRFELAELLDLFDRQVVAGPVQQRVMQRSEEHTSELKSLMRISYAVFCLKKKKINNTNKVNNDK